MGKHYVPQKYLKGWAVPSQPECIFQYDKQTGKFCESPLPIKQVAQGGSGFYNAADEEKLNMVVERPANTVLDKLRSYNFDLSENERVHLAGYMATMMKRVPKNRQRARDLAPKVLTEFMEEVRSQIRGYAEAGKLSPEMTERRLRETDEAEEKFRVTPPPSVIEQTNNPWPTPDMVQMVYGMHWRFVVADISQYFLTSDNPLFFFQSFGIGTENSEITFPICHDICLFGSFTPIGTGKKVLKWPLIVREANRRLASVATRFLYFRSKAEWIAALASKSHLNLNQICWAKRDELAGPM